MSGKVEKIDGETWYQWASRLFEYQNCPECGKGVRDHLPRVLMGKWFALCKSAIAKTPLFNGFELWMESNYPELDSYVWDVYLTDSEECIPDEYMGDDIMKAIRSKFHRPLEYIGDLVCAELKSKKRPLIFTFIDPDYEDATAYALLMTDHKTGVTHVLYYATCKAWHFEFENMAQFEEELRTIYNIVKKALKRLKVR